MTKRLDYQDSQSTILPALTELSPGQLESVTGGDGEFDAAVLKNLKNEGWQFGTPQAGKPQWACARSWAAPRDEVAYKLADCN